MRSYKRKTDRKPITPEMLVEARRRLQEGQSNRSIAQTFGVDESSDESSRKRLKRGFGVTSLGRFKSTFTVGQEESLADHCRQMDLRFYGITRKHFRHLAFEFASQNNIKTNFNQVTQMAGEDWTQRFLFRHKLSLRTPQKTSLGRIMGFNRVQIERFYDNLTEVMSKHAFPASRVFNVDESGITTVPNKIPKVISAKGKRSVNKVASAERGQLITVVCCFSASGNYVPPALIFPRKRTKIELLNGAPPDSVMFISDSGYMNSQLFISWLEHFQKHVRGSAENPVLLILDNHSSHVTLEAVSFCKSNHIHLLSIPLHSSHKTQPLDRCFFKSLKDFYGQLCDQWLVNHPGRVITQSEVAQIFGEAYGKNCTIGKAMNAFKICGIVPVNRFIFSDEDFLPASVTDQTVENESDVGGAEMDQDEEDNEPLSNFVKQNTLGSGPSEQLSCGNSPFSSQQPSTITPNVHHTTLNCRTPQPTSSRRIFDASLPVSHPEPSTSKRNICNLTPQPFPSKEINDTFSSTLLLSTKRKSCSAVSIDPSHVISPSDILPLPRISQKRKRMRMGKKSEILTSTPNKEELEREREIKLQKERRKEARNAKKMGGLVLRELSSQKVQPCRGETEEEVVCPGCNEIYENPPDEDWIECSKCHNWWHESCSNYETGEFKCDFC